MLVQKRDKFGVKALPNLVRKRDLFFKKTWCDKRDKLIKMEQKRHILKTYPALSTKRTRFVVKNENFGDFSVLTLTSPCT